MQRSLKDLERYAVSASDGDIGKVVDFLLDDERWVIRYLVVETGEFLNNRRVLISPVSFRQAEWSTRRFHLALTKDRVRNAPSVDLDKPVSRQHERAFFSYYGYSCYWGWAGLWGAGSSPGLLANGQGNQAPGDDSPKSADAHLRSANEVRGYHVEGSDGAIGHVDDFIVDDETWAVRYLVVDTGTWWFGKKVLVAPDWATRIAWAESGVHVDISRKAIKSSPEWNPTDGVNREFETRLHDYYGRPGYWAAGAGPQLPPPHPTSHR